MENPAGRGDLVRWPWQKREAGGGYSDEVIRRAEQRAASATVDASSTAAMEAASGALSRAFASATVKGPEWAKRAVSRRWLAQTGRDLVRIGRSLSVIEVDGMGATRLVNGAFWNWQGGALEESWTVRVSTYGPSRPKTRLLTRDRVVFATWGATPGSVYLGQGPATWAATTAKLQSEVESMLADEASGPIAQLLAIPQDGGSGGDDDPLAMLKADIRAAAGRALFVETTSGGHGTGRANAPSAGNRDWMASRLGANPPAALVELADSAFARMLAACGVPPAMFGDKADGTAQREALRRWHMNVVVPLGLVLADELTERLETEIRLEFDDYPRDLAGRAATFQKLVAGGLAVNEALSTSGLLVASDDA